MIFLFACSDYDLFGSDEDVVAPSPVDDDWNPRSDTADTGSPTDSCPSAPLAAEELAPERGTCQPRQVAIDWTMALEAEAAPANDGASLRTLPANSDGSVDIHVTATSMFNVLTSTGEWRSVWSDPEGVSDLSTVSFRDAGGTTVAFTGTRSGNNNGYYMSFVPLGSDPSFGGGSSLEMLPGGRIDFDVITGVVDHDGDGVPTVYDMRATWGPDGVPITRFEETATGETPLVPLFLPGTAQSGARLANAVGVWDFDTGTGLRWERTFGDRVLFMGARDADGDLVVIVGGSGWLCSMDPATGRAHWCESVPGRDGEGHSIDPVDAALGDVDGDGVPEICAPWGGASVLLDLDGTERWRVAHEGRPTAGACAMADLDADGRYEVIDWNASGLFILDGETGVPLADNAGAVVAYGSHYGGPFVADLDADGSAEIFVTGPVPDADVESSARQHAVAIYGSPTSAWAPTRPAWNQVGYDLTTVANDGSLVPWPEPAWDVYNAYRAQPAMDGDFADLSPELLDACAESCAPGGEVVVTARVNNTGSRDAGEGIDLALLTDATGTLDEVARVTLPGALPAMTASASVELRATVEALGTRQFLKVIPADRLDECNPGNDRVEVSIEACEGE
ncbi:MAG: hypothetical protein FJ102_23070 [Deltaproteobacteria bacterium]|nr:hypothetical protein [Deltaproteobacteria bacterium]